MTETKPDIPLDIWEASSTEAMTFVDWLRHGNSTGSLSEHAVTGLADCFARALVHERKRCAKTAEKRGKELGEMAIGSDIAETILRPEQSPSTLTKEQENGNG